MAKKLFALADNKCAVEGADGVMMQECLLGGHLYLQVIKEKLNSWLLGLRATIANRATKTSTGLGLMQNTGLSIDAENINRMRYMSHFRAIFIEVLFSKKCAQPKLDNCYLMLVVNIFLKILTEIKLL